MARFVIIDDEYYFRQSLKVILSETELDIECVGEANNGEAGLSLISQASPDFAIVDINMPVLGGLEMIQQYVQTGASCHFILLTGYAEFAYAKQAVGIGVDDYILKPVDPEELVGAIQRTLQAIEAQNSVQQKMNRMQRNILFQNLFLCWNETEVSRCQSITNHWHFPVYRCIILCYPQRDQAFIQDNIAEKCIHTNIEDLIIEKFSYYPDKLCYLLNYSTEEAFHALTEHIASVIRHINCKIGIGAAYKNLSEFHHSYYQAMISANYLGNEKITLYHDTLEAKGSQEIASKFCPQLTLAVTSGDAQKTTRLFEELEKECARLQLGYYDFLMLYIPVYHSMTALIRKHHLEQEAGSFTKFHEQLGQIRPVKELLDSLKETGEKLCQMFCTAETHNGYISQILEYIHEHYRESNLSVALLASHFSLNYGYLCTMFKKHVGTTINNYITELRLEQAKSALDAGNTNISQAASSVGYTDPSYFCKCFKKKYGSSPQQYITALSKTYGSFQH